MASEDKKLEKKLKGDKKPMSEGAAFAFEIIKGAVLSLLFTLVLILLLALVMKFVALNELAIAIINQVIRCVSILLACIISFKNKSRGLVKGLVVGIIYVALSFIVFSLLSGEFTFGVGLLIDSITSIITGIVSGIIAVNIRGKA